MTTKENLSKENQMELTKQFLEQMELTKQFLELAFQKLEVVQQDIQAAYQHLAQLHLILENPEQEETEATPVPEKVETKQPEKPKNLLEKVFSQKKGVVQKKEIVEEASPAKSWKESEENTDNQSEETGTFP